MEKFSFNLFIFTTILIFATHSEMMAEARGPVISCRCSKTEDCHGICAACPNYKCINNLCTCLSDAPPFP
ncbi:hypothetical protein F383_19274 [Gossypium arboreum]|uniref:Uncharacterized protein n=3 Tax=Gossypium TaxID=3633 RepID=A0A0B0ME70_GOSAR|nr:hypothetical protein ERO13_A12G147150v2 [Gossypium hirsutum]KHG00448.1 hypothetical protein F383_19274 [Gossypium arboreum]TYH96348.1 hypothetical protein ES332_A12G170700v1 [Gossypium tomentosum]TYJ05381.1 hypothetical protein E1A91_A12G160100v1 [Gossypium mustelinum]